MARRIQYSENDSPGEFLAPQTSEDHRSALNTSPDGSDVDDEPVGPSSPVVVCCYTTDRRLSLTAAATTAAERLSPDDKLVAVVDHNQQLYLRAIRDAGRSNPGAPIIEGTHDHARRHRNIAANQRIIYLEADRP